MDDKFAKMTKSSSEINGQTISSMKNRGQSMYIAPNKNPLNSARAGQASLMAELMAKQQAMKL